MSAEKHIYIHVISSLYVCVVKIDISAMLCKHGASDEDPSFVMINLRGVSTKLYLYIYIYIRSI